MTPDQMGINDQMLLIKALDSTASLQFSEFTKQWYVSAHIEISDGAMVGSVTIHAASPANAVLRFLEALVKIDVTTLERIVVNAHRENRREYRWNGMAFTDCAVG